MIFCPLKAVARLIPLLAIAFMLSCADERASTSVTSSPSGESTIAAAAPPGSEGGAGSIASASSSINRLDKVRSRGHLVCASSDAIPGFGYVVDGHNAGFDIDRCRAVAAAVLGDPLAIEVITTVPADLGDVLRSGEVDMASRIITATTNREAQWGSFVQTMYYDGQGFIVHRSLGVAAARELAGASVCVTSNTTTELNLADYSGLHNLALRAVPFERTADAVDAYLNGQCDAFTTDHSGLHAYLGSFPNPGDHFVLPDVLSEEPLTPIVPHGDEQWHDIVSTVMAILIYSEAFGVTSGGVPTSATGDARVDRLFGLDGSFGQADLGLSRTVAQDVIRGVGNYGEIYERHLAPLGLERRGSRNALWANAPCTDCPRGGQIYAVPLR